MHLLGLTFLLYFLKLSVGNCILITPEDPFLENGTYDFLLNFSLNPPLPFHISRATYLISMQLYTIAKQSI